MTQKRLFVFVEFENGGERRSTSSGTNTTFTARKVMFFTPVCDSVHSGGGDGALCRGVSGGSLSGGVSVRETPRDPPPVR